MAGRLGESGDSVGGGTVVDSAEMGDYLEK